MSAQVATPHDTGLPPVSKVLGLFTKREKVRLGWLMVAVLVMGFMDVLGVSSILPFLAVVAKPDVIQTVPTLQAVYEGLGFSSVSRFLFFLGSLSLGAILASSAVTFAVSWGILWYAHSLGHALSVRILRNYLAQPYTFFLNHNSSKLALTVTDEVEGVVNGVVLQMIQAVARAIVAACLLLLVFVVDPLLASAFVVVVGGAYLVIFSQTRSKVAELGYQSQDARHVRFRGSVEAFGGIKDLMLMGRQGFFFNRFSEASQRYARNQSRHGAIALIPRSALEAISFGAILLIVLYLLGTSADMSKALPLLALYAFTGYRLMPALQQIFQSVTTIRFNWPSVELVSDELGEPGTTHEPVASGRAAIVPTLKLEHAIALKEISFAYPGAASNVLDRFKLTIAKNTTVGLVGSTGSGKTTLVDIIMGLLIPQPGTLLIDGTPVTAENRRAWQNNIGYVPQQIFLSDDTIARNIAFGLPDEAIDMDRVYDAARTANIHKFIGEDLPLGYDTVVGERGIRLSGGQRQRIGIARAVYHDPHVLIMDEATSALDGITEDAIIEAIHELSHEKTIITIAHRLSTVRDCDVIVLLEGGRAVDQGTYAELMVRSQTFRGMAKLAG